ncbi:hypothetical protein B0H66DRAFT_187093 [Apodospora peruviana]|uniref:Uncharacterized protein n=1 Tax=Apodospora peruviana TaxID=516989 RepID=A0AAE0IBH0_9PEZI|nr:hypothetical protein B0H66DRAFT_187093 [Apodospora peruviana]
MTEPEHNRPGSSAAAYHASSIPSSPRPSVNSRGSRTSLRREHERQEAIAQARPMSVAQSHSQSPQLPSAAPVEQPAKLPQQNLSFTPPFTLITSSNHPSQRQTTHHPTVHYIFADDDPEVLTAALAQHHRQTDQDETDEQASSIHPNDRAVVLDMVPMSDGTSLEVAWASSLSPDWAIVSASVSHVEGGEAGPGTPAGGHNGNPGGLVLKIEGVSIEPPSSGTAVSGKTHSPETGQQSPGGSGTKRQQQPSAAEEYAGLIADFDKRMALLRRVVNTGAERQRRLDADGETHEADAPAAGPVEEQAVTERPAAGEEDDARD